MFGSLCKRSPLVIPNRRVLVGYDYSSKQQLLYPNAPFTRLIFSKALSSLSIIGKEGSFTVSYLINKCGLSPENAISAAKKVHFESPAKPDNVLNLLKSHGFTDTLIAKLVSRRPLVLLAKPEKTILPKLQFFNSIGFPPADLAAVISYYPIFIESSLKNHIVPTYDQIRSLVHSDKRVVSVFKNSPLVLNHGNLKKIYSCISILREIGVPESWISSTVSRYTGAMLRGNGEFVEIVKKVTALGFDPSKMTFLNAVEVMCGMAETTLERKKEVYRSWGWSEDDLRVAFLVHPNCMKLSETNITSSMDFLVNKMGCQSAAIAKYPVILFFSLEKRVVPRCRVFQVLKLKGLVRSSLSINSILSYSNKKFLDKFVTKYEEDIPQLLDVYQGKTGLKELGFGSGEARD